MNTVTTQSFTGLSPVAMRDKSVSIVLADADRTRALELAQSKPLASIDDKDVVMFGAERQRALASKLDEILGEITKANSPLLFELFKQLKEGVKDADIAELEEKIRASLATTWWHRLLDSVGLSSVAKRMEAASKRISSMIQSKSTSLRDLMKGMETQVQQEVLRLISDSSRLKRLAGEYKVNVVEFAVSVEAGRQILVKARTESEAKIKAANESGDPVAVEEAKAFQQKVDLFESRVLVLETAYAKAPAELESIRLSQGASLSTLGETANSVLEEFNDIKSSLIKLSVLYQIQSVQVMNQERRRLRETLQKHGVKLLETVSTDAARLLGENRLADAELLLSVANGIKSIGDRVEEEHRNNQARFAEAREKLAEAKNVLSQIDEGKRRIAPNAQS